MNRTHLIASLQAAFRPLAPACFALVFWNHPLLASDPLPLPLPDAIQFAETIKLPPGVKERTLACSIVSEDDNVLVVETSAVPGVNARLSLDKTLLAEVKRGDPSLRPFAELAPELPLPPESREVVYYDEKLDRFFHPFLKKFPKSPGSPAVSDAKKAYSEELQRVINGEFRAGTRWTQKSLLTPIDLRAIELIQKARAEGVDMTLDDFKKLIEESRKCFASEFFPRLGEILEQVSVKRTAKIKAPEPSTDPAAPKPPTLEELKKPEVEAMIPFAGWNWDNSNKAIDMVWEAENKLKSSPPDQIAVSLDLILRSLKPMPFLLARERVLRQQSAAYAEKGVEEAKALHRSLSASWFHGALQLAAQLPPPENQTASRAILDIFEKSFMEQVAILIERRQYDQAKAWYENITELMTKTPAAQSRLPALNRQMGDFNKTLQKRINQQTIDNLRKVLAEYLVKNDFEGAQSTLSTQWENIEKLKPSAEETMIFAHAALDQSASAFKSFKPVSGYQLLVLAKRISPQDPKVKNWILTASMIALAAFLVLLFPLFWILARFSVLLINIRYRIRMKSLKKKAPKRSYDGPPRKR